MSSRHPGKPTDDEQDAGAEAFYGIESEARCGGTGMVAYWDGSAYAGEMCRGCIDCEPPAAALAPHPARPEEEE